MAATDRVALYPRRMDATGQTEVESFDVMNPSADGFRNYAKIIYTVPARVC